MFCDTPGFEDTEGTDMDVANSVAVTSTIRSCGSFRLVLLIHAGVCRHVCRLPYGHMCRRVCRHVHRHVFGHVHRHVYSYVCVDVYIGLRVDICTSMCIDMCIDM